MNETPENSVPTPLQPVPASLRPEWRPPAPARGLSAPRLCRDSVLTPAARQPPEAYDVQSFLPWFDSCSLPRQSRNPTSASHRLTEIIGEDSTVTRHGFRSLARDLEET